MLFYRRVSRRYIFPARSYRAFIIIIVRYRVRGKLDHLGQRRRERRQPARRYNPCRVANSDVRTLVLPETEYRVLSPDNLDFRRPPRASFGRSLRVVDKRDHESRDGETRVSGVQQRRGIYNKKMAL